MRKLRGKRADEAIAGAGGVHRRHRAAANHQRLVIDHRQHASLAKRDADDLTFTDPQRFRGVDEALDLVVIPKRLACEQAKLRLIEHKNIGQAEQFGVNRARRSGIEDRGGAGRSGAGEEGGYRGQRNLEL